MQKRTYADLKSPAEFEELNFRKTTLTNCMLSKCTSKEPKKNQPTPANFNLQTNTEVIFHCHFRSEFHPKDRSVFIQLVPYVLTICLFFNASSINSDQQYLMVHSLEENKETKGNNLCSKWELHNFSRNKSR